MSVGSTGIVATPLSDSKSGDGKDTQLSLPEELDEVAKQKVTDLVRGGYLTTDAAEHVFKAAEYDLKVMFAWQEAKKGLPCLLFATHSWFTSPQALFDKFWDQYNVPVKPRKTFLPPSHADREWNDSAKAATRRNVCLALL